MQSKTPLFLLGLWLGLARACTKEEYLARFGDAYTLHGFPLPSLSQSQTSLSATVTYDVLCDNAESLTVFTVQKMEKEDQKIDAFLIHRHESICTSPSMFPSAVTETIEIAMPDGVTTGDKFLAFPPDQVYELTLLTPRPEAIDVPTNASATASESAPSAIKARVIGLDSVTS